MTTPPSLPPAMDPHQMTTPPPNPPGSQPEWADEVITLLRDTVVIDEKHVLDVTTDFFELLPVILARHAPTAPVPAPVEKTAQNFQQVPATSELVERLEEEAKSGYESGLTKTLTDAIAALTQGARERERERLKFYIATTIQPEEHAKVISDLRAQLQAATAERDALLAECERHKADKQMMGKKGSEVILSLMAERDALKVEHEKDVETVWNMGKKCQVAIEKAEAERDALDTEARALAGALEPARFIYAQEPDTATKTDTFERGCPLTPPQIRQMQHALAAHRARGAGGEKK